MVKDRSLVRKIPSFEKDNHYPIQDSEMAKTTENVRRPWEATGINQDRDITAMEDIEGQNQVLFTSNSVNFWLNLPDVPFNLLMMMQSITQLRILTQVSSTLKKRIKKNILERPVKNKILRARIERVMGPGIIPSNEEITNAMWLSKFELS